VCGRRNGCCCWSVAALGATITDVVGMTSSLAYGDGDFIAAMTTPYGTTTFRHEAPFSPARRIEATDPAGGTERAEYHLTHPELSSTVASSEVPTGFSAHNVLMNKYVVLYWDKLAMAAGPTLGNATITNLLIGANSMSSHHYARNIPQSVKRPLESRVWYEYADMSATSHGSGTTRLPITIARVLEGGASQITELTYNAQGEVTAVTDPLGRRTTYSYDTNGLDLLEARQVVSGGTDLLGSFADYTLHLPETITDGAGNDTTITYNSFRQPLTITNAKSETTTFVYETTTQNLLTVTGPVSGATTTFTYDAFNRVESVEGSDGYEVVYAYDALDRLTSRTYPDATTETFTYSRLDVVQAKDRLGRISRHFYDGYGRRIATRDPAGRTISQVWCECGSMEALIDGKGQRTSWDRDVQGRVTREIRADGTTDTLYTYDLTGRLKTITDPMDQVTTFSYNNDDSLASTGFTNETIATPDISHTYETYYPRPATMVDGNGTTTYTYKAAGTNGAANLASVDGPFSSDTISYTYDELGRVLTRMLNGTGTEITYDALGRLSQLEFPVGAFDYTYAGHTGRVSTVTYPNNQTSTYSYLDDEYDFRLQTIHHKNPSAATLSKFDYTYEAVGNIMTWRQERAGSAAKIYTFTHDLVDQLTSAVLTDTNSTPTILKRQAWSYDVAGNRTVDQIDDAVFATTHNSLNRLGSRAPGGPIVFAGSLNEGGSVTIDGQPATLDASNNFRGTATLSGATTTVTLKAKDASGNETTKQYEVDSSGSTTSYTYDANGNLTADGTKTYHWNALNQLVEVREGSTTIATFEYDGDGRRTEKVAGGVTHTYIYDAEDIVEERLTGSTTATIRYYHDAGIDQPLARKDSSDVVTYYLADHLGSIVQETNATGAVTLEREYDPWGVAVQGGSTSGYAFTGREWDAETGLSFYRARYYSPQSGRWLNEDPIGLAGGSHLSAYVSNNPTRLIDPFGLCGDQPGENLKDRLVRNLLGLMDMLTLAEPVQAPGVGEADSPVPDRSPDTAVVIAMTLIPAASKTNLAKMMQSEAGVAQLLAGGGEVIAGAGHKTPIGDIARLLTQYGGTNADWVKITSTTGGLQTHAYKNITTQVVVELKSKIR
jgi:RHS repeat-associated protein